MSLTAQTAQPSSEVSAHLDALFSVLQREWLDRNTFDWAAFRRRVIERASGARTIPESYDAVRLALALLGDRHSYYIAASGEYLFNPESPTQSTGECTPAAFRPPEIPADIGYVRIQITPPTSTEALQDAVRRAGRAGVVGWVVDLRNSRGGNTWPALAGIGPLLGNGTAGFFIGADKRATPWGYLDGEAWLDLGESAGPRTLALAKAPHQLSVANARVAVLTDVGVASSGEATAIAYRGRPNTRSFGTRTCGLSTSVEQFRLSNGARLAVVTGVMADRTMTAYGGAVEPDESISDPTQSVARAVAWLRSPP